MLLCVACNEERNGNFAGFARGIIIIADDDEILIALEPRFVDEDPPFNFDHLAKTVTICGRTYPARQHATWYGNWCWDCWRVDEETARQIAWDCLWSDEGQKMPDVWKLEMAVEGWMEADLIAWKEARDQAARQKAAFEAHPALALEESEIPA